MRRLLLPLLLALAAPLPAEAWNAAGHRLSAAVAWAEMSPATRDWVAAALARHPAHPRWQDKARPGEPMDILAEASTWADSIRNDPDIPDADKHRRWHYVDFDARGRVAAGELDRQVERLAGRLRSTADPEEISRSLPWLVHLVGDLHQPLHVGRHDDRGGNALQIENPYNRRRPFTSLHAYWDDLPGPPWLRGRRLEQKAQRLRADHPAPAFGKVAAWRDESRQLLGEAYPDAVGSLLPLVDEAFHRRAQAIAERRVAEAGYRLGRLLEAIHRARVSRGTP
ncbi:S1/P1 nuclease [Azonexus sp.]|uniref:S1/P1 nuclease n=1 Tax=Azonexus sp. TaxID=1872668 RepID=UPI0035AEA945